MWNISYQSTEWLTPDICLRCSETDYFVTNIGAKEIHQAPLVRDNQVQVLGTLQCVCSLSYKLSSQSKVQGHYTLLPWLPSIIHQSCIRIKLEAGCVAVCCWMQDLPGSPSCILLHHCDKSCLPICTAPFLFPFYDTRRTHWITHLLLRKKGPIFWSTKIKGSP